jgi:hypothetical protein
MALWLVFVTIPPANKLPAIRRAATAVVRDLFIVIWFGSSELKIGVFAKKTKAVRGTAWFHT